MAGSPIDGLEADACLAEGELRAAIAGEEDERLVDHLALCESCRKRLEAMSGADFIELDPAADVEQSDALERAMISLKSQPLSAAKIDLADWLEPIDDPELLGTLQGYQVRRIVEEGGMGVVLEAWDPELEREVAIKLIKPASGAKQEVRDRMLREARAAAGIVHESVVPIYAAETLEKNGMPFIVMPFVRGGSLQDRLDSVGDALSPDEVVAIGAQVAEALAAAHARGILHRDIKPANILMRGDGKIWVADFGLACAADDDMLTREGEMSGTPQFMAPEQVEGRDIDERSDLFSLGGVLYQMATGKQAFSGENGLAIVRAVVDSDPIAVRTANPDVPAWLAEVVESLLQKDPGQRPCDAVQVAKSLGLVASERAAGTGHARIIIAALVLLLGLGALILTEKNRSATPSEAWKLAGFSNLNSETGYASLEAAIASARDGEIIEIKKDGVVSVGRLDLADKHLVLRAGIGHTPEFMVSSGSMALINNHKPLRLEGLRFILAPGVTETGPIFNAQAPLALANCYFFRPPNTSRRVGVSAIIHADNARHLMLANVEMIALHGSAVRISSGNVKVEFENCFVVAEKCISLGVVEQTEIVMRRSAFHGRYFIHARATDEPFRPMRIRAENSVFETRKNLVALLGRTPDELEGALTFEGRDNLYNSDSLGFLSFSATANETPELDTLPRWVEFWGGLETGSAESEIDLMQRMAQMRQAESFNADELQPPSFDTEKFPDRGVDASIGGAQHYDVFRKTATYADWVKRADAAMVEE
ncbi:MAG: hypothetical protein ACI9R3_002170 [Verrucomicrobiales bacterium]|jgi:hypothetical protein